MNTIDEALLRQINDPEFPATSWTPKDIDGIIAFIRDARGTGLKLRKVTAPTRDPDMEAKVKARVAEALGVKPQPKVKFLRRF